MGARIRKTVLRLVVLMGLAAATFAVLARFVVHGPVDGTSLHDSITAATPSAGGFLGDLTGCRAAVAARTWSCSVIDEHRSGGADYLVTVEAGSSCWRAELTLDQSEGNMPKRVRGCVHLWQWSLLDL